MANNSPGNNISTNVLGPRYNAGAPVNGVDEVHTITGAATGGTIPFTYGNRQTAQLPFNVSAAALQTALQGLGSINAGNVICTGGPLGTAPIVCTFGGELSGLDVPMISVDNTLATGGVVSVASTTNGVSGTARGSLPGASLTDTTNAIAYINTGTAAKPTWTKVGLQT
ncbi:hypothetical protein CCAX7_14580 [Capsulimonas corticalis]|uniref:Uncharacterized protein n=1 Tax=Capsulimonas corticalis TaxID=2219043 RepID=A0A402CZI2_9BACT|nr:hypothetical protein [Capsulimonas corticalis]BDI29407.1 hypothetical protein CCAX7_14580 [Capsulimonas corticalis]